MDEDPAERTLLAGTLDAGPGGGRYRIQRELGGGAQKTVWLVFDTELDRECALSLIADRSSSDDEVARFRREAKAMARLGSHPNVVTVHDIGMHDGAPYVVCEYVPGGDLRAELKRSPDGLDYTRALVVARDILAGLDFAHAKGLVHRDLKPANVWLTGDGRAKLGDFGLAMAHDWSHLTAVGTILGTPAYMAPEQVQGIRVDGRADLYSFGCLFHELLTGKPPFMADDVMAVLYQQVHVPPPPAGPQVPRGIERVLLRLLAKDPDDRPATAAEVLAELDRVTAQEPQWVAAPERPGPPLVGRKLELGNLRDAFRSALAGTGAARFVVGESGIGKSRLVRELGREAEGEGAVVLVGTCVEAEVGLPFVPWAEVLRSLLDDDRTRGELGSHRSMLERLLPSHGAGTMAQPLTGADRYAAFEAVSQALVALARTRGLVLILEDLHWADRPSLLLLGHLVRQLSRSRLMVIGTYRDTDVDRQHPLGECLAEFRRARLFERVLLRGLPLEDARALVDGSGTSLNDSLIGELLREADGNPFFIEELVRHVAEAGPACVAELGIPEGIREVVGRRVSRLSAVANRMLSLAAVVGLAFSWSVVVLAADDSENELLDALDEAISAQIVRERNASAGVYEFSHALIRQTLRDELSRPRRAKIHRVVATAMERIHGADLDAHRAEIAHHLLHAGTRPDVLRAVPLALEAARRAEAMMAVEEASGLLEAVLAGVENVGGEPRAEAELLCELGAARIAVGHAGGREDCRQAIQLAVELGDPELRGRAALAFASAFNFGLVDQDKVHQLRGALDGLPNEDLPVRAQVQARLAAALQPADDYLAHIELAKDAFAMARRIGDPRLLLSCLRMGMAALIDLALVEERLPLNEEMLALALSLGDRGAEFRARLRLVFDRLELGDLEAADRHIAACDSLAARTGNPMVEWNTRLMQAMRCIMQGRFEQADQLRADGLAVAAKIDDRNAPGCANLQTYFSLMAQHRWDEMVAMGEHMLHHMARYGVLGEWASVIVAEGLARANRIDDARRMLSVVPDLPALYAPENLAATLHGFIAIGADETVARARRDLAGLASHLLPYGPTCMIVEGPVGRCLAAAALHSGDEDSGDRYYAQAIEVAEQTGLVVGAIDCRIDWARSLAARGRLSEANALRERARADAEALGLSYIVAELSG